MTRPLSNLPYSLMVDDDDVIVILACVILEGAGFRTLTAPSGDAAIEVLKQHHEGIVLLFTDVQMPGQRNGFALARETAQCWPHISIVVASSESAPGVGQMPEGATFIRKPFSADIIRERLAEILPEGQKPLPLKNMA